MSQESSFSSPVADHAPMVGRRPYFPHLDGLRFFAFLTVYVSHGLGYNPYYRQWPDHGFWGFVKAHFLGMGAWGVDFFFVLSGFLITYLLLTELSATGRLSIARFYMRRVLRIWPAYYLVVLLGFVLMPALLVKLKPEWSPFDTSVPGAWYLYGFFLANFDILWHGHHSPVLQVLWSVAVEEQFYLCWPWLVRLRGTLWKYAAVVAASIVYRFCHAGNENTIAFHTFAVICYLACGALVAHLVFHRPGFVRLAASLSRFMIGLGYLAGLAVFAVSGCKFSPGHFRQWYVAAEPLLMGGFYCFVIVEQNFAVHSLFKVGRVAAFTRLGRISYGLYLYHLVAIFLVVTAFRGLHLHPEPLNLGVYAAEFCLSLAAAIGLSSLSYRFFESPFLSLKDGRFGSPASA